MARLERDVARYENWLRRQCDVVEPDLIVKHQRMRKSPFDFMRATYFRWVRTIEAIAPTLRKAPRVLGVGDIHVANYGLWLDADMRQVWGVNDFDEVSVLPYTLDLLRLATSARFVPAFTFSEALTAACVLDGYRQGLSHPGPALLDQGSSWFAGLMTDMVSQIPEFWLEVDGYPEARPPTAVRRALVRALPSGAVAERFATRRKGGGSLGRPRYLVIARWQGGRILREAKALAPSAWDWAHRSGKERPRFMIVAAGRYRSPDASLRLAGDFVLRRVAPDSQKLELEEVAKRGHGDTLLHAMSADLGAIHAAHRRAAQVGLDLAARPQDWLVDAIGRAQAAVQSDFDAWTAVPADDAGPT